MRSRIKVGGKYYRPVPWVVDSECQGCVFQEISGCPHEATDCCDWGNEFQGVIFIRMGKEAMAEYIAKRLEPDE